MTEAKTANRPLLKVEIGQETDFLFARQRAKQIAEVLGYDPQDQTRIATAVSELARNAYEYARTGRVDFYFDRNPLPSMRVIVTDKGPGISNLDDIWSGKYRSGSGMGLGLVGAKRLSDQFDIKTSRHGTVVTFSKRLRQKNSNTPLPSDREIAERLASVTRSSVEGALREQSTEVLRLLEDLRERELELMNLNRELEETNRGVLVLYAELQDKAESLQQASEMKSRFLSGVTHELRTPLNSIVSLSRLLLSHVDGDLSPEQDKQVNFVLKSAMNLNEMVNDLLDLARIEAGKTTIKTSRFTVGDMFSALRGMFRPLATSDQVALIFDDSLNHIELQTDEGKLAQVLRNFISNALKFTNHGSVNVSAHIKDGNSITFTVTDTGVGIPESARDLVFEEWGQVENPNQAKHKGSGLGLPLAKRLTELLGGSIGFESQVGKGSKFYVSLPVLAGGTTCNAQDRDTERSLKASNILIVDDDEVSRYLIRRKLGDMTTANIREAASGPQAFEAVKEQVPDLIFLDVVMPEINGIRVARQLRSEDATANVPIVFVTSKKLTPDERAAMEELSQDIMEKRQDSDEEFHVRLERALLSVGLRNVHQDNNR